MDCFSVVHPIENQTIAQNSPIYLRHQLRRITGIKSCFFAGNWRKSLKTLDYAKQRLWMFEKDSDAHGDWAADVVLGGRMAQDDGFGGFGLPAAQGGGAAAVEVDRICHVEL